jgi:hypothetical protein
MKISHFVALLKYYAVMVWTVPLVSIALGWYFAFDVGRQTDHMFFLTEEGPGVFLFLVPFMCIYLIFTDGPGIKSSGGKSLGSLEFFFSKAISRTSLFCVKVSLFLMLGVLPLVTVWAYSLTKPTIRIELPYNTVEHREATKQFYLTHFQGAYLQKDEQDKEGNKVFVVLPKGQVNRSVFTMIWTFTGILLFQVMTFAFFPVHRWISVSTLFTFMILTSFFGGASMKSPSLYEIGLAWITQHTLLTLLELGLLTILTQLYCCWRFVNTEITS